jgi:hypothetical protein
MWVSEACQLFLVPSWSSSTPLYPTKVLRAREHALTPYSFVIFCLGLTFESLKELGVHQFPSHLIFYCMAEIQIYQWRFVVSLMRWWTSMLHKCGWRCVLNVQSSFEELCQQRLRTLSLLNTWIHYSMQLSGVEVIDHQFIGSMWRTMFICNKLHDDVGCNNRPHYECERCYLLEFSCWKVVMVLFGRTMCVIVRHVTSQMWMVQLTQVWQWYEPAWGVCCVGLEME